MPLQKYKSATNPQIRKNHTGGKHCFVDLWQICRYVKLLFYHTFNWFKGKAVDGAGAVFS